MSKDHFGNVQPLLDNEEHEHTYEPATKRVMPYGWDGSAKKTLKVDANGQLNIIDTVANSLVPSSYDYISLSYTGPLLTGVVFKLGGSSGTTVSTLVLGYDGSNLTSVTKS